MKTTIFFFSLAIGCITAGYGQTEGDKQNILTVIDQNSDVFGAISRQIWELAEVGYKEEKSAALLQEQLGKAGFEVTANVAGMPTAFVASFGSGKPVIGILGEYDALPGLSQVDEPVQKARVTGAAGHGCGHNLFGSGSALAAIAIKNWLESSGKSGTIRFYGTPAEEGGAGKVYMVRDGLFDDVDAVLHWHPSSANNASATSSLANKSAKFRFYGKPSHASGAPEQGRSALDGVEAMNHMVNMMREHIPSDTRVHYVITNGGAAPNVVPAFAEVYYYVRNPEVEKVQEIFERVVKASEGAAMGTETRVEHEIIHGIYNLLPNKALAEVMDKNLHLIGGIEYTPEEKALAERLQATFDKKPPLENAGKIEPFQVVEKGTGGSTDVADISWVVPTAGLGTATFIPGSPGHSWQSTVAAGSSIGRKAMVNASKTIALAAYDLFNTPDLLQAAKEELNERRGSDFEYKSLVGDRTPPLDYRDVN